MLGCLRRRGERKEKEREETKEREERIAPRSPKVVSPTASDGQVEIVELTEIVTSVQ